MFIPWYSTAKQKHLQMNLGMQNEQLSVQMMLSCSAGEAQFW